MARTIINAKDVRKALNGEQVEPLKKRHARAAKVAESICQQLVFLFDVEPEAKYFADCKTMDELKAAYKELAIKHHPDRGGDTATMAAINAEYDSKVKELAKTSKRSSKQKAAEKAAGMTAEEIEAAIAAEFKKVLEAIAPLQGITIELIGAWLWVSGDTKPIKDTLKANGFRWAPKKEGQPWVWHDSYTYYPSARGRKTKEDIEDKYGKQVLKTA